MNGGRHSSRRECAMARSACPFGAIALIIHHKHTNHIHKKCRRITSRLAILDKEKQKNS